MTKTETISWIFFATALAANNETTNFNKISALADGINHAVPSHKEMQTSFTWLMKHGLIIKKGESYLLTEKGNVEYNAATKNTENVLSIWKNLEMKFLDYKPL